VVNISKGLKEYGDGLQLNGRGESNVSKGQVDSSVIVGMVVVLIVVAAAGFGVYYFGFMRPQRIQLEETRDQALATLDAELEPIDTTQANQAASRIRSDIMEADDEEEVRALMGEISHYANLEGTREELEELVTKGTRNSYTLEDVRTDLVVNLNDKESMEELEEFRGEIINRMNYEWTSLHLEELKSIGGENMEGENVVIIERNDFVSERHMTVEEAEIFVEEQGWETLRGIEIKEKNTFRVPIYVDDGYRWVSEIDPGDRVDIMVRYGQDNLVPRSTSAEVFDVLYSSGISSVSDPTDEDFDTDVWEQIKAEKAGSTEAEEDWDDWAQSFIQKARDDANLVDYDFEALFIIEVHSDEVSSDLLEIQQFDEVEEEIVLRLRD